MHRKKMDERLKVEKTKLIYYVAIIQNIILAAELIYEAVSENRPLREVITFDNPMAVVFLIFFIPFLIISVIYGVKNDDDDKVGHLPIIISTIILTGIFAGAMFLIDGSISANTGLVILIVGIFLFVFSEFINFCREK
ncbi:hypothetical protein [Weissella bombi]|uniref:Uncharacterized protein n=1 Tax=Weissella bombi TaxID=1505725 RepID=A0A1C3YVN0_9LACO|nr:hypothetical protein [Weissella bombi]SCB74120.1 hypothetical protein GA0061074_101160 [Weissella bombi]